MDLGVYFDAGDGSITAKQTDNINKVKINDITRTTSNTVKYFP